MFACCSSSTVQTSDEVIDEVVQLPARTAKDKSLSPSEALTKLKEGNARYVGGRSLRHAKPGDLRSALATDGQNPYAVVVGCADSRCPVETTFDAHPGDVFVLRNAGNACPSGEGSIVGSAEYAVGALGTQLVVIMGHTKCGAMVGATKLVVGPDAKPQAPAAAGSRSALEEYLAALTPASTAASKKLGAGASVDEVAAEAIRLNVLRTIESLLANSAPLREKAQAGGVELHGAVYNIETGAVEFMGPHPELKSLLAAGGATKAPDAGLGA